MSGKGPNGNRTNGNGSNGNGNGNGAVQSDESSDRDTLAALAAAEGRGLYADVDLAEREVERYELAAGAAFAAWPRSGVDVVPTDGFEERVADTIVGQLTLVGSSRRDGHDLSALRGSVVARAATEAVSAGSQAHGSPAERLRLVGAMGWLAAAALLAALLRGGLPATPEQVPSLSLDAQVAALEARGATITPWADGGPAGGVVWSDQLNSGFMRFDGLETNDPTVRQYQLWIFRGTDPGAEAHPVDGGVFDVLEAGEVIVPIDAKLDVGSAGLFAVTIEKPGGVVVSGRDQIVAVAVRG